MVLVICERDACRHAVRRRRVLDGAGRRTRGNRRAGGASAEVSTLWAGAGCTEPVISGEACGFDAHWLSPNLEKSLLQPANPAAKAANKARRDTAREREGSTKLDMDHSLVRNN